VTQPWAGTDSEPAVGVLRRTVGFCFEPVGGGTDTTCELEVPIAATGAHLYKFGTTDGTGNPVEIAYHDMPGFRGEVTRH
jgi:hypothetical protein